MEIIIKQPIVSIDMTYPDAELFKKFQKHYKLFKFLVEKGVFDQKNATLLLNFDENSVLSSIGRHDSLFDSRFEVGQVL